MDKNCDRPLNPFLMLTLVTAGEYNQEGLPYELQLWLLEGKTPVQLLEVEGYKTHTEAISAEYDFWHPTYLCDYFTKEDYTKAFVQPSRRIRLCSYDGKCIYQNGSGNYCTFIGYPDSSFAIPRGDHLDIHTSQQNPGIIAAICKLFHLECTEK